MGPPITQTTTTNSNSASSGSSIPTNRLERESKKYDRRYVYHPFSFNLILVIYFRSDLVCRVRYTNVLPDLPFDPKFLRYPFSQDRFIIFCINIYIY
jgi:hypothetical protein